MVMRVTKMDETQEATITSTSLETSAKESPKETVSPDHEKTEETTTVPPPVSNEEEDDEDNLRSLFPSGRLEESEFSITGKEELMNGEHCLEENGHSGGDGGGEEETSKEHKKRKGKKKSFVTNRRLRLDPEAEKQFRLNQEKKLWSQSIVQKALFDEFGLDREYTVVSADLLDSPHLSLDIVPGSRLRNELLEDLLNLTRRNMKSLYDGAGSEAWSWSDTRKRGELRSDRMRWALLKTSSDESIPVPESGESGIVGFAAFRFTTELGIPHMYLHELQVLSSCQGKGYGSILMNAIEKVARVTNMQLIMLTVFSANAQAIKFYKKIGFSIDEASPGPCYYLFEEDEHRSPYEIMSKVLDPEVLKFGCSEEGCGFRCRFPDTLTQHNGLSHHQPWPFPCKYPGCLGGTVHLHQLQKHVEIKHTLKSNNGQNQDQQIQQQGYLHARVTFKSDGRKGTVMKLGDKGFYTVRMDGPTLETVVCRAASFLGHQSQPVKKKVYDPDHELALKLQYEEGWSRRSARINKSSTL